MGDIGVRFTAGAGGYFPLGECDGYHFLESSCFLPGQDLELDADRSEEPLGFESLGFRVLGLGFRVLELDADRNEEPLGF